METKPEFVRVAVLHWIASLLEESGVLEVPLWKGERSRQSVFLSRDGHCSDTLRRLCASSQPVFPAVVASLAFAQEVKPVADRLAAQNALFEEQYESDLRNFPERATAYGDYRYNDKLAECSFHAIEEPLNPTRSSLPAGSHLRRTGFSDQDQLSHDLLVRVSQQRIADST